MNQITDPPNTYGFGLDFNYALWTKDTRLSLVNVPWNNDYRDIVKFADRAALNAYLTSIENVGVVIDNVSYVKPNQPVRISLPFNAAYRYNYLRASSPVQPVNGDIQRDYYYFITDVRYIAPNTTEIVVQLDVWQTFGFDLTFGNSYIERGHIGIANEKAFNNYGRDYLTIPEGLDIGGEYNIIARRNRKIMETPTMDILLISTIELDDDYGTVDNPKLKTATGNKIQDIPGGASAYVFDNQNGFIAFMAYMKDFPWVTQGFVSITAIPPLSRYGYGSEVISAYSEFGMRKFTSNAGDQSRQLGVSEFINWRDSSEISDRIDSRYRNLRKLFTYPYMVIELTTWGGTPIILKPESWADANAFINEKAVLGPPNQRVVIYPRRYNAVAGSEIDTISIPGGGGGQTVTYDDGGDYLDKATQVTNFPTFSIVNNMAIAYMANNANSIAFQNQSADWSQQRALAGNQNTYDQMSAGIEMSKSINSMQRLGAAATLGNDQAALTQSVALNGAAGVVGGAIGTGLGGLTGGVGGAAGSAGGVIGAVQGQIMGGLNSGIAMEQQNRNLAVSQNVSRTTNTLETNQTGYIRDTNKSLTDWAAKGDYENSIAGINAKVQDAQLTQPSTSGQVGGETFNLIHGGIEYSLRWKFINRSALRVVGEYWLRYGYAVRQFAQIPPSLMVMSKFTYWKLSETYVTAANMPEYVKQAIRGIFEKGVTVWANPSDIGNTDIADNDVIGGFEL